MQQKFIYMFSLLVIPDLSNHRLVVSEEHREPYEAELQKHGGREGRVRLPPAPPTFFVLPPRDASGAFVLGGPRFEFRHGMITSEQELARGVTVSQEASQGAAEEDDASVESWDGNFGGASTFLARKRRRAAFLRSRLGPWAAKSVSSMVLLLPRIR